MFSSEFIAVAVALRLVASLSYLSATWRGIIRPNPVTWLFWGLTPLVAFAAQIQDGVVEPQAWVTLTLGASLLPIFVVAVARRTHWQVDRPDALCGGSAAVGVIFWQLTSDPAIAVVFSIVADMLAAAPTVAKAYRAPNSERSLPYLIGTSSTAVTLLTTDDWSFVECALPIYVLLLETTVFTLVRMRSARLDVQGGHRLAHRLGAAGRQRTKTAGVGWVGHVPAVQA